MRLGRIRTDIQRTLGVLHVVVRIGHRPVTPGVGNTSDRCGVTDSRLMVAVVGAKHAHELPEHVRLLVVVLRRAHPEHAIRACGLTQIDELVAHLIERLLPTDADVLSVDQFHGVFQAMFAVPVLANGSPFGTVCAEVDRRIENRLLSRPYAVFYNCINRAAHGAV